MVFIWYYLTLFHGPHFLSRASQEEEEDMFTGSPSEDDPTFSLTEHDDSSDLERCRL